MTRQGIDSPDLPAPFLVATARVPSLKAGALRRLNYSADSSLLTRLAWVVYCFDEIRVFLSRKEVEDNTIPASSGRATATHSSIIHVLLTVVFHWCHSALLCTWWWLRQGQCACCFCTILIINIRTLNYHSQRPPLQCKLPALLIIVMQQLWTDVVMKIASTKSFIELQLIDDYQRNI